MAIEGSAMILESKIEQFANGERTVLYKVKSFDAGLYTNATSRMNKSEVILNHIGVCD